MAGMVDVKRESLMRKIGILGGLSAASSQIYYTIFCQLTQDRLGGLNSPDLILRSVNFAPLAAHMYAGEWQAIGKILNQEARTLQNAGAEVLVLASNTMHKVEEAMMQSVTIPLIHIVDATADALHAGGCKRPAVIATKFTMEEKFYLEKLQATKLTPIVPNQTQREDINRIIFDELCRNEIHPESEKVYVDIVRSLIDAGADSVILGCTEVCMLLHAGNTPVPVFDTTRIHCEAALSYAIGKHETR